MLIVCVSQYFINKHDRSTTKPSKCFVSPARKTMDCDSLTKNLEKLEQSIRYLGKGTNWLLLEPVNQELLASLSHLGEKAAESSASAARPPMEPVSMATHQSANPLGIRSDSIVSKPVSTESTPLQAAAKTQQDLDPLTASNLDSLRLRLRDCTRCKLCQNRSTVVYGQGNQKSEIVFIGEGPGEEEDRTGLAFVGKAGKLLTQMIHSIGINREAVYICNIVKCRPPGNRNPEAEEIDACFPFLKKQLEFLKPKLIVTLGNVATKALIPDAVGIVKMRGRIIDFNGITLIPTFHPSYLLRNQTALSDVWNDLRKIRQVLHQQQLNRTT